MKQTKEHGEKRKAPKTGGFLTLQRISGSEGPKILCFIPWAEALSSGPGITARSFPKVFPTDWFPAEDGGGDKGEPLTGACLKIWCHFLWK